MFQKAYELIEKNWETLSKAPLASFLVLVVGIVLGWSVAKFLYNERMHTIEERIKNKDDLIRGRDDSIKAKDDLITEYRERLHLIPPDQTAYSRLINDELKKKTLILVTKIRDFIRVTEEETIRSSMALSDAMRIANSEEERQKMWYQNIENSRQKSTQQLIEYDRQFRSETILLRDEMIRRLPEERYKDQRTPIFHYEVVNGSSYAMRRVTDDLERLALSLPIATR